MLMLALGIQLDRGDLSNRSGRRRHQYMSAAPAGSGIAMTNGGIDVAV
jgi:hypothetical protein